MNTITINLDLSPKERWNFAAAYSQEINEIIACYWKDIEDYVELISLVLEDYKASFVPIAYWEEIQTIARFCDYSADQVLIANLYYDIVKYAFACTAFACATQQGIWHARNLDWWTDNDVLKKYTKTFNFVKGGKTVFQSVGWVGFVGVLSGMKPQHFSITLNAIVSEEAPNLAKPISFLLREVLEGGYTFQQAKVLLENSPIVCDCLLLLAGTQAREMVVIERTPTTYKTRTSKQHYIIVTNDYLLMEQTSKQQDILSSSSCHRYDSTQALIEQHNPQLPQAYYQILKHPDVKMQITVQQMLFNASLNKIEVQ